MTVEKLLKYAVLTHDIFASYDLCHFVLAALQRRDGSNWTGRYLDFLGVVRPPALSA